MRSQRGISGTEILIIVVVVAMLAGAGAAVVHTYNRAIAENETLKTKNEELTEAHQDQLVENAGLVARQELLDEQTARRKGTDQRIDAFERKFNDTLGKLYAQSPEARKWRDTPIPDDVRRGLRNRATGGASGDQDNKGAPAAPVVKPDAGPGMSHPGGGNGRPLGLRPPAGVQPK